MSVAQLLEMAINPNAEARKHAEEQLRTARERELGTYVQALVGELCNPSASPVVRQLAGVELKNNFTAKNPERRNQLQQSWFQMGDEVRGQVKVNVLGVFGHELREARMIAALAVSTIAIIELPVNQWPGLVRQLVKCAQPDAGQGQREAALACLGYICEECDSETLALKEESNNILTAVVNSLRPDQANPIEIRGLAANALINSLHFISANMENQAERTEVLKVVIQATQKDSGPEALRASAMECLVGIAQFYYPTLKPHMEDLMSLTLGAITNEQEEVALQAVEFWNTLAEVESSIIEDPGDNEWECGNYVRQYISPLWMQLSQQLVKQEEDADDDACNLPNAAGICIGLAAFAAPDAILGTVYPFVKTSTKHDDWHFREAALLTFGSVLEGPPMGDDVRRFADDLLESVANCTLDPHMIVRDSAIWAIGKVCEGERATHAMKYNDKILEILLNTIRKDTEVRVVSKACWAIDNYAEFFESQELETGEEAETLPISKYYGVLTETLLALTEDPRGSQFNMRNIAYDAISSLLGCAPKDTFGILQAIVGELLKRANAVLQATSQGAGGGEVSTKLGHLCGALQICTRKLRGALEQDVQDHLMRLFLNMLTMRKSLNIFEEALMAIGSLAEAMGPRFGPRMPDIKVHLIEALRQTEQENLVNVAVGLVGDVASAMKKEVAPYCPEILTEFLALLRQNTEDDVKATIISTLGDLFMAVGSESHAWLGTCMPCVSEYEKRWHPGQAQTDEDMEFVNKLRENVCEFYTGVLQGLKEGEGRAQLGSYAPQVQEFVLRVWKDRDDMEDSVLQSTTALVGDVLDVFRQSALSLYNMEQIQELIKYGMISDDEDLKDTAKWVKTKAREAMAKQ